MQISAELKDIVSQSVQLLGKVIQEIYGVKLYQEIESLRVQMKTLRGQDPRLVEHVLKQVHENLDSANSDDLHKIAKSFSLMLELINVCEAAYRSSRLGNYEIKVQKIPQAIVYVFTSHPTEARSRDFLEVITKAEDLLVTALKEGFEKVATRLEYLLKIAVRISLSNNRRPQVKDEIEQIFLLVLNSSILTEQIRLKDNGIEVLFRTWVGGDKDGHPFVGPATMLQSLQFSRTMLFKFAKSKLDQYKNDLRLLNPPSNLAKAQIDFEKKFLLLKNLIAGDGLKVMAARKSFEKLKTQAQNFDLFSPDLKDLETLWEIYPALVLALEIREDSALIHEALLKPKMAIAEMLKTLKKTANGADYRWYVRGFIISMCQTPLDMSAAIKLTHKITGSLSLPVVPLFENEEGLLNSISILKESFKNHGLIKLHTESFGARFEVMVGYSDSSKENGVLPARLMVEKALNELDKFLLSSKLTPVFFHGSGGSTSRGGGSVQEQTAWWPKSALDLYKVTIQGEMVQRNFSQPLIMRSLVGKAVEGFSSYKNIKAQNPEAILHFSSMIQKSYRVLVSNVSFQELVSVVTPYQYLSLLKIGSRPSKRTGKGVFTLRAIPWILCWTQTRLLLPVWWGTGSAWSKLTPEEKASIKEFYAHSPIMQSYVKNLGFTFARIELGVWNFHMANSKLKNEEKEKWRKEITDELDLSITFFQEISGEKNFTWFRPWLSESIYFRSSMIHPLNVIQKIAIARNDTVLLRETVTGIACGMLTTG